MTLASGTRLNAYVIGAPLGVGGMGEVYRATDTTLGREVAVKVLPPAFAADAERIARFEREAKTLATLNHPNIAQIYGLEKHGEGAALIMELVEGPTLADRIAEGPLPPDEALRIARQLIDGLEAAHDKGIVHRDFKPANIKLRPDGAVKILDFGIAKPGGIHGISGGNSPAVTTPAMTESGVIMGTAAYMSPEQARGKAVDQRADIWAFGCVLYEMLTGQPAFGGEDVMTTLARVLDRDTDLDSIPHSLTPAVRHTIKLCLRKEAKKRLSHIGDVRLALAGELESGVAKGGTAAALPWWRKLVPLAATAVVTAGITSAFFLQTAPSAPAAPPRRSVQVLPSDQALNFPVLNAVDLADDGSQLVYGANAALYIRNLNELEPRLVPGTENEMPLVPDISPSGKWIAYAFNTESLKRIPREGGTPLPVLNFLPSNGFNWVDDNTLIYGHENEAWTVTADGADPKLLFQDESGYDVTVPVLLPGTDYVLYQRRNPEATASEIAVASTRNGERTILFPGYQATYDPAGYLFYVDPTLGLMARAFDPATLEYGSAVVMVDDILRVQRNRGASQLSIAANGSLLYVRGESDAGGTGTLLQTDEASVLRQLAVPDSSYTFPSVSPDGRQVAVENADQIFVYPLDGSSEIRQLTREGTNRQPTWSLDGLWVTYVSTRDGPERIYRQRADGSGVAEALTEGVAGKLQRFPAWAPDGRLAFSMPGEAGDVDIWIVALPLGTPEVLISGDGSQSQVAFSPDGRALAYTSDDEVLVQPFPPDGSSTRVSVASDVSAFPVWSRQGATLNYMTLRNGGSLSAVDIAVPGFALRNRRDLPFLLQPDGRKADSIPGSDQLLLAAPPQTVGGGTAVAPELVIVENWIEEVKARVPKLD